VAARRRPTVADAVRRGKAGLAPEGRPLASVIGVSRDIDLVTDARSAAHTLGSTLSVSPPPSLPNHRRREHQPRVTTSSEPNASAMASAPSAHSAQSRVRSAVTEGGCQAMAQLVHQAGA
jgi:hypothetical protein